MTTVPALLTPTLAAIHERHSVRSYADTPVDRHSIEILLDAAVWAPSAMNSQPWAFVVIQDPDLLARCEHEANAGYFVDPPTGELATYPSETLDGIRALLRSPDFDILHGAPALIVIYATDGSGVNDCYLAAENILLAATTLGLGSCPIGFARPYFEQPEVKAELGVPAEFVCALPIVLGESTQASSPHVHTPPHVLAWR